MKQIRQQLNLVLSLTTFFLLVNALNFLNSAAGVSIYWKLAGALIIVLFIASLKTEEDTDQEKDELPTHG